MSLLKTEGTIMIGDPKEEKEYINKLIKEVGKKEGKSRYPGFRLLADMKTFFQFIGTIFQVLLGLGVVTISVLGLIQPLWLSMIFGILGSVTVLVCIYTAYRLVKSNHIFDSLINRAIRRVIQSQN